jgi:hypothetical protein
MKQDRTYDHIEALRERAFHEAIAYEQTFQYEVFGGAEHDDKHNLSDWALLIGEQSGKIFQDITNQLYGSSSIPDYLSETRLRIFRSQVIILAAVCRSAVDAIDRSLERKQDARSKNLPSDGKS